MLRYTICFIRRGNQLLMLHRKNPPNQNKWNGVGGKLEVGEEPEQACIREIQEETGLIAHHLAYRGIVSFGNGDGMYLFTTDDVSGEVGLCDEGTLAWKSIGWVLSASDVTVTLPFFLEEALGFSDPVEHAFTFTATGEIERYEVRALPAEFQLKEGLGANHAWVGATSNHR